MYVWEVIAQRLRLEGWSIWHMACRDACGETYLVHGYREGIEWQAWGPTLTEAFAESAKRARGSLRTDRPWLGWSAAWAG